MNGMITTIEDEYRYYCASCVRELVDEGIAMESDMAILVPAPEGHTCDWCMVGDATLMEPHGEGE